nr:MAG TPA: hypothetical protein [Bacteriophage sp.]DAG25767.1 MAG TPA: hypothetical protein [Bacteriophage sp.]DAH14141.1 MAG TPA: hypothetical protein [Caudoviricetes sp.]DAN23296.1 MAG TPA_asm: hypothetical protein [Bacteriophage sp.]
MLQLQMLASIMLRAFRQLMQHLCTLKIIRSTTALIIKV